MAKLSQYFWTLVEQLPSLLTMIGCIVFALMRWKRHPRVSLVIIVGLGLLIFHAIAFLIIYDVVPPLFIKQGNFEETESIRRTVYLILGLIFNSVIAVAFTFLLAGVFMRRKAAPLSEQQPG